MWLMLLTENMKSLRAWPGLFYKNPPSQLIEQKKISTKQHYKFISWINAVISQPLWRRTGLSLFCLALKTHVHTHLRTLDRCRSGVSSDLGFGFIRLGEMVIDRQLCHDSVPVTSGPEVCVWPRAKGVISPLLLLWELTSDLSSPGGKGPVPEGRPRKMWRETRIWLQK